MLTRNYRCVHRYTCLSAALLLRLFEFRTRYTANQGKPHVDAIKDGSETFIFENVSRWTFFDEISKPERLLLLLSNERFFEINTWLFVYNYPFKGVVYRVTNKVIIRRWWIRFELWKFSCMVNWYERTFRAHCFLLPGWMAINRIREMLRVNLFL